MEAKLAHQILSFNTNEQNIFFTSDTHFWHENIIKFCNRPFSSVEEMNDTIIDNWNKVVGENDIVFHLGDFCFCGSDKSKAIIERLNGRIYLILGNHDWKTIKNWHTSKFEGVCQQLSIKVNGRKIYLNHFPFLCYAGTYYKSEDAVWQLFGHTHTSKQNTGLDNRRLSILFPTQYDVGVDNNNYTPVSFEQIKNIIETQIKISNELFMFKVEFSNGKIISFSSKDELLHYVSNNWGVQMYQIAIKDKCIFLVDKLGSMFAVIGTIE